MNDEIGVVVYCIICDLRKCPMGRDPGIYLANLLCDWECPGYKQDPQPGDLWPGETREEFGYG